MKKLFLVFGVLIGLVSLNSPSYALRALDSTNKTVYAQPLISTQGSGTSFVTGSVNTQTITYCNQLLLGPTSGSSEGLLMACPGQPIVSLALSGGASGGTVTIYDANTNNSNTLYPMEAGLQEVVFEATVAANTQLYVDLTNAPINTNNGVVAAATSTSGVVVYTSTAIASNH